MLIRRATFEDVPAVARLLLAALSKESPWSIFVSAEAQADADCVKYVEAMLQSHLQSVDVGEGHFWVVELSGTEDGTHPESVIVSAAICEAFPASSSDSCSSSASSYLSVASSSMLPLGRPSSKNCQTGGSEFTDVVDKADPPSQFHKDTPGTFANLQQTLAEASGGSSSSCSPCLNLVVLVTRPDCQRQGYGKALCARAIEIAKRRQLPLRVQSSPRGYILFSELGFVDVGLLPFDKFQADHELVLKSLVLDPARWKQRGSVMSTLLGCFIH